MNKSGSAHRNSVIARKEGKLLIEVKDTGIGMTKDNLTNLFKPFQSAGKGIHSKFGGTGIGLWISKTIVKLMKGRIDVKSHPGEGSSFYLTFPV